MQRTQMDILAARKIYGQKESSYNQTMKDNEGLMTSLNELNF